MDYFSENGEERDGELLLAAAEYINDFAKKYPLTVEMGRFMAASCGTYLTRIEDEKVTGGIRYGICDGGIHQLRYYGQTMAMQIPKIEVLNPKSEEACDWSLCGSLCTTADVLVRKVSLSGAARGSVLAFESCGAYSVCEGISLFLSRDIPAVYLFDCEKGLREVRRAADMSAFNTPVGEL